MKSFGICECNGSENTGCKKLSLIGRVLACPGPSVVTGQGGCFHVFTQKCQRDSPLPCLEAHRGRFLMLDVE
jgi:hypothetical protein